MPSTSTSTPRRDTASNTSTSPNESLATTTPLQEKMTVSEKAPAELTAVVDELVDALSSKFSSVSAEIFSKMDDMSRRLDALEDTVQAGGGKGVK